MNVFIMLRPSLSIVAYDDDYDHDVAAPTVNE